MVESGLVSSTQKMLEEIKFMPVDLTQIEAKYGHLVPKTDYELVIS